MSSIPAGLQRLTVQHWQQLAQGLIIANPELARQFRYLDALIESTAADSLRKLTHTFVGASKCPSASGCERLAARTRWILSILSAGLLDEKRTAETLQAALEKLLPACEGADDRSGLFRPAVRELVQNVLHWVVDCSWTSSEKVDFLFHLAMLDLCTLVEPIWWWNPILKLDAVHAIKLAADRISQLDEIQPSADRSWKTLGGRWTRLRLKSFLEHANAPALLADLMARSAVDDFEAAQAIALLRQTHRGREALMLAERWSRLMPSSPVIAWALAELYLEDGWNEEARDLINWHYERDPNPRWMTLLEKLR